MAPAWHTGALVAFLVVGAILGAALQPRGMPGRDALVSKVGAVYLPTIALELGLLGYVARVGRNRWMLVPLLGPMWRSAPRRILGDLGLAVAAMALIHAVELIFLILAPHHAAHVSAMLPRTAFEHGIWAVVAVIAGFSEEVVFRGYLQLQLSVCSKSPAIGIVAQAVLFGLMHGYQGALAGVRIVLYGVLFGGLSYWRRSLLPGIACHVATDLVSGL